MDFATANFGAVRYAELSPHQIRILPASQRHIRWYSLDMLRLQAQSKLPLLVNVSSTSTESEFVFYNCTLTSTTSQKTWSVSYRYSEFVEFKEKVDTEWTCQSDNCSGSCQALRDIVSAYFPKKRLAVMSSSLSAISSRKTKFENVLTHLLCSVLLPGSSMRCLHARQHLPMSLFEFLDVKDPADRPSVFQIFIDQFKLLSKTRYWIQRSA